MSKRKSIKTPRSEVFNYWKDKAIMPDGEVIPAMNMPEGARLVVEDWGEPCCWGCGCGFHELYRMRKYDRLIGSTDIADIAAIWDLSPVELERCHILPDAAGGEDKPENLFLLCHRCHIESPDTTEPRYFFRWVHRQRGRGPNYDGFFCRELTGAFLDECRYMHKDPFSMDADACTVRLLQHWGAGIAESSLVAGMADACRDLQVGVDFDEFMRGHGGMSDG